MGAKAIRVKKKKSNDINPLIIFCMYDMQNS